MIAAFVKRYWLDLAVVAFVLTAGAYVYRQGVSHENARRVAEVAQLNQRHEKALADIDGANRTELARLERQRRDAEQANGRAMAALDAQHLKERNEQKSISDRTIAGLRAGTVRLREQYAAARPGDGGAAGSVPSTSASPGLGDGAASGGFGESDVIAILGAAADGDGWAVQLRACQAIVRADRGQ